MTKLIDSVEIRKKNTLWRIAKNYLLSPLLITVIFVLLNSFFNVPINYSIYGVILGLWIGVFLRFILFDLEPNYVYNINTTENNLILELINPIGKLHEVRIPLNELKNIELGKKSIWRFFDKIYVQRENEVRNYRILDRNLMKEKLNSVEC